MALGIVLVGMLSASAITLLVAVYTAASLPLLFFVYIVSGMAAMGVTLLFTELWTPPQQPMTKTEE